MPRKKKEGHFFNCYLKNDLIFKINAYSEEAGLSKTAIVEKALDDYFNKKDPNTEKTRKEGEK